MDGFVIGIALRQQVPLRAGVQNPEYGFQHRSGGDGLTPWAWYPGGAPRGNVSESGPIDRRTDGACPVL